MEIHQYEFVDTLIQEMKCMRSMNNHSRSVFPDQPPSNEFKTHNPISDSHQIGMLPSDPHATNLTEPWILTSEVGQSTEEIDFKDDILKYIGQMLMEEEDLEHKPCMFQECSALQAAEKSFYDVLGEKYPPSQNCHSPNDKFSSPCSSGESSNGSISIENFLEPDPFHDQRNFTSSFTQPSPTADSTFLPFGLTNNFSGSVDGGLDYLLSSVQVPDSVIGIQQNFPHSHITNGDPKLDHSLPFEASEFHDLKVTVEAGENSRDHSSYETRGKKNHYREDGDFVEAGRSTKQLASYTDESSEQLEDDVLLCPELRPESIQKELLLCLNDDALHGGATSIVQQNGLSKGRSNRGRPRGKKQATKKEVVDLRTLLTQCAQAVSSYDSRTANDLLKRIKQHSSACGDGTERLAHYFGNALEARLAGTGTALYAASASRRVSAADGLKGYQVYVKACPFSKMSNFFANRSIGRLAQSAPRLHIIDFGILYGFQWPCLIQHLSLRPGGPPKLRITGIDFPQPGFRPAERVEETGRRLAKYCVKFGVPFEYSAVAKKWETIQLQDFKIEADEVLVVNCLYRLKNVPDDTVVASSPRDEVLNLVHRLNPDLFVHGVVNGTYNAPFFGTRFREAVFHYSALFDMFEAAVAREDDYRRTFEREVFGRDIMNVIACEGTERVERPETYKQWQVRNIRAGFRQLTLDKDTVDGARNRVRNGYDKDFVVDEANNWMLLGWRGRIVHAISCWKPVQES